MRQNANHGMLSKCLFKLAFINNLGISHIVCFLSMVGLLCVSNLSYANNVNISNVQFSSRNSTNQTINIQFDMAWENSWRNNTNHDALWVFVKYSNDSGSTWKHATLNSSGTNPAGFSVGSGTGVEVVVPSDKKGAFVKRSMNGVGSVSVSDLEFVWNYGADGLTASSSARVKVFATEMVYVPSGSFKFGDKATSVGSAKKGSSDNEPWQIISASSISVSNAVSNGSYYVGAGNSGEAATGASFTIPASYPNGYAPFYMMKHELSESAWVDFFNTLSASQKLNRDITSVVGKNSDSTVNRNTVSWITGNATSTRLDRSCSFLSWMDGASFADWAALRPMTELEYEKTARGSRVDSTAGEYAWGSTSIIQATSLSGAEDGTETVTTDQANASFGNASLVGGDAGIGPLRSGIFATDSSTKIRASSGFYGALDLSGNLAERVVTIGNSKGRSFLGTHGDGELSTTSNFEGNATNSDWPGIDATVARGVTGADGSGLRGGSWADTSDRLRVSDRQNSAKNDSARDGSYGFRAVRSAS